MAHGPIKPVGTELRIDLIPEKPIANELGNPSEDPAGAVRPVVGIYETIEIVGEGLARPSLAELMGSLGSVPFSPLFSETAAQALARLGSAGIPNLQTGQIFLDIDRNFAFEIEATAEFDTATGHVVRFGSDIIQEELYLDNKNLEMFVGDLRRAGVDVEYRHENAATSDPGYLKITKDSLNAAIDTGRLVIEVDAEGTAIVLPKY